MWCLRRAAEKTESPLSHHDDWCFVAAEFAPSDPEFGHACIRHPMRMRLPMGMGDFLSAQHKPRFGVESLALAMG